ncbi:MAG: type II toxin-antitoxin system RelE/ParE family toxin [Bdellovibrionales bacterium]|nr:type II toxin-antitoxin system RelE/ParE family toxin [Bdellovibrionales bacterium]
MTTKFYAVEFKKSAIKDLKPLPKEVQQRIIDSMNLLAVDPFSSILPIRKMQGSSSENLYRLRIGSYRVVYEVQREKVVILVIRIGHRKDVYR